MIFFSSLCFATGWSYSSSFFCFFLPASLRPSPGGKSGYLHSLSQQCEKQVAAISLVLSTLSVLMETVNYKRDGYPPQPLLLLEEGGCK